MNLIDLVKAMQESKDLPARTFWRLIAGLSVLILVYRLPDIIALAVGGQ